MLSMINKSWVYICAYVRLTKKTTHALNMGSYNYLGFAQNFGKCADDAETAVNSCGLGICSSQHELGAYVFVSAFCWYCTHTHTRLTALFPGLPGWAGTRKLKPIGILLKQETVSGSGINWAICKSAPRCRQITMPAPHHSVFYRPDALPVTQPTASKHWRQFVDIAV